MRLIGVEGEQIGVVTLTVANRMAEEAEVDLVEIAPTAQPPGVPSDGLWQVSLSGKQEKTRGQA